MSDIIRTYYIDQSAKWACWQTEILITPCTKCGRNVQCVYYSINEDKNIAQCHSSFFCNHCIFVVKHAGKYEFITKNSFVVKDIPRTWAGW